MITVATVLRSGGEHTVDDVARLCRAVRVHLPVAHRFVCLTDSISPVEAMRLQIDAIPLEHPWPGWWSKMNLYAPGTFDGLVIYFDLDSVIAGDLTPFAEYAGDRAVVRDFYRGNRDNMIQTCMWIWRDDALRPVWDAFMQQPEDYIAEYTRRRRRSDDFTRHHCEPCDRIQELWPGTVASFKKDCIGNPKVPEISVYRTYPGSVPDDARVICFHGFPRPSNLPADHWLWRHRGVALSRAA